MGIKIPNLTRPLFCILNNRYFDKVEDTFILRLMSEFFSNIFNTKQVVIILIFLQRQQPLFSAISKKSLGIDNLLHFSPISLIPNRLLSF
ncbi:MAG: hypothetical protein ACTH8E_10250 [Brochothrix thermosphacta]|uniref:hypothetical protein n=1 Tax=Brochothrix thermosphacta TaxID=2756 RepID=UPI003F8DC596